MSQLLPSTKLKPNEAFTESPREPSEDNIAWLARQLQSLDPRPCVLLVGGIDQVSFRLRVAQSRLRQDLTPSAFSHAAFMLRTHSELARSTLHEISLTPPQGFGFPTPKNGLTQGTLEQYRNAQAFPNIALVCLTAPEGIGSNAELEDRLEQAVARFPLTRAHVDCVALIVDWLAYVWGVGTTTNPLLEGKGIPSAVCAELIGEGAGSPLTSNVANRSSSPEAIWQSARWWGEDGAFTLPCEGRYTVPHWY
jgi:hypothetical protein